MNKVFGLLMASLMMLPSCSRNEAEKKEFSGGLKEGAAGQLLVINVLDKPFYDDAHIKGSRHVPFMEIEDFADKLDKQTTVVFYCSNYACSASGSAAQMLIDMGFKNVFAYEGGIAEWYQLKFPVEGPAQQNYLKVETKKMEDMEPDYPVISAQDLKKIMEEHKLL